MPNWKYHLRSTLLSVVGFGFGLTAGALLSDLIFKSGLLDTLLDLFQAGGVMVGVVLALAVAGIGGAVGGAIGGLTLSYAHQAPHRWGYAWRSALSFGPGYALVVVPLTLAVALMAFYELAEASPLTLMIPLGLMGAIFGAVSGLILGLLTVGWDTWRVFLVGTVSFALGGAGLGRGLFGYLLNLEDLSEARWSLFLGLFIFGAIGGGALGFLYSWLAHRRPAPGLPSRFAAWFKGKSTVRRVLAVTGLVILFLALRAVWLISPFTASEASLATTLELKTIDTHWASPLPLAENAVQPAISAAASGPTALAWSEGADVFYLSGDAQPAPVNVSNSERLSTSPQIVADETGQVHLIWVEETSDAGNTEIFYSRCQDSNCTPPVSLSNISNLACLSEPSPQNSEPVVAIDSTGTLLVAWRNGQDNLLYTTWPAAAETPDTPTGCIALDLRSDEIAVQQPRLAGGNDGAFSLAFAQLDGAQNGEIYVNQYTGDGWSRPELVGAGLHPEIFIDGDDQNHVAWCGPEGTIAYRQSGGQVEQIPFPRCTGRPGLAGGSSGGLRLVWYAGEVENVGGVSQPTALLYESVQMEQGWTDPAIVAQTGGATQPAMAAGSDGTLYLTWTATAEEPSSLYYATHKAYDCTGVELSATGQAVLDVVQQEGFQPGSDLIPFCHNQFDRFMYAPNPLSAYSAAAPTPNGTFDKFAELATTAQYEVVFATMWYDSFSQADNPGRVLGRAIAELYQKLKADPSRYPRGLTIRLLLGNPPSFAFFPSFNNQVWSLIGDLRAAGVPELQNDDIGWNLEVANFSGSWPHSHTKLMIVDGKTVQAVGYNMQHTHLPTDHPSGKGKGRVDLGMQVTGPVAQTSLRAFDDLWQASTRVRCETIDPNESALWMLSCQTERATDEHVPEVLRYYVPDSTGNAFAIYRTQAFNEGDNAHAQALASAVDTIDTIHINFSLELICALNILVEACNYANRIEYMEAMMQAIEKNDVKVRILVSDVAWVGIENDIAIQAFEEELAARGLSDNVEIRYFEQDMHIKSALINGEFLIVGNQNFHYSAWGGTGSLAEFNLGIEDPEAIEAYQRYFNYYWDRAKRRE